MRKVIPLLLVLVLLLSMSIHAVATETPEQAFDVKAKYEPRIVASDIITVDIAWEGMNFTYSGGSDPTWDPETHQYIPGTNADWKTSNAYISITNHSNRVLQATLDYTKGTGYEQMDMAFADETPYIGSAETGGGEDTICTVNIQAIPMGTLPIQTTQEATVGEIKVTVTSCDNYATAFSAIGQYIQTPVIGLDNLARGNTYFESQDVVNDIVDRYTDATIAEESGDAEEINLALNNFIEAYYNNLKLAQK